SAGVPAEGTKLLAGACVPDPDGSVVARAGEALTVVAEGHTQDRDSAPVEGEKFWIHKALEIVPFPTAALLLATLQQLPGSTYFPYIPIAPSQIDTVNVSELVQLFPRLLFSLEGRLRPSPQPGHAHADKDQQHDDREKSSGCRLGRVSPHPL